MSDTMTLSLAPVAPLHAHVPTITGVDDNCDTCFGTGEIYAKPGVFRPCPSCCGFTQAAVAVAAGSVLAVGCLECMHDCGGTGCGCTCCCSYLPAVTGGGAR